MIQPTSTSAWTPLRRGRAIVVAVTLALTSWGCSGAGVTTLSDTQSCMVGASDLLAIGATPGAAEVWAVGAQGVMLHETQGAWRCVVPNITARGALRLTGVAFASVDEGYAVGSDDDGCVILRYSQGAWTRVACAAPYTEEPLYAVSVDTDGNGWAVGGEGALLRLQGGASEAGPKLFGLGYYAIALSADGRSGYAAGEQGQVAQLSDGVWQLVTSQLNGVLRGILGDNLTWRAIASVDATTWLFAGAQNGGGAPGALARNVRGAWVEDHWQGGVNVFNNLPSFYALATPDECAGWAAGEDGGLWYCQDDEWRAWVGAPTHQTIRGLTRDDDGVYWAVGDGATLLRATSADTETNWEPVTVGA